MRKPKPYGGNIGEHKSPSPKMWPWAMVFWKKSIQTNQNQKQIFGKFTSQNHQIPSSQPTDFIIIGIHQAGIAFEFSNASRWIETSRTKTAAEWLQVHKNKTRTSMWQSDIIWIQLHEFTKSGQVRIIHQNLSIIPSDSIVHETCKTLN